VPPRLSWYDKPFVLRETGMRSRGRKFAWGAMSTCESVW
jgi:hypothetical protein